ncbi:MFS family permease [Catenulispora sp. GP43]|uniref:MFS transporter n=1 Tax=Catenulispora sp. GP43 TaxID=3156263 RepID=UPI003511FC0F
MADRAARTLFGDTTFRRLWIGAGLSALGSQFTALAVPLLVLRQTGSPRLAGVVATCRFVVFFAVQLPCGVIADRLARRAVLLTADAVRAVALAVMTGAALKRPGDIVLWLIICLTAEGVFSAAANVAAMAAMPEVVPEPRRATALALGQMQGAAVQLAGPLLGGLLFAAGPAVPFAVDAASYLASLALLLLVRRPLGGGGKDEDFTLRGDLVVGLAFVRRSRYLMILMLWSALMNFGTAGLGFVVVVAVGGEHHGRLLGPALALAALGSMAGAALAPRFGEVDEDRIIRSVTAGIVLLTLGATAAAEPVVVAACFAGVALLGPIVVIPKNVRVYTLVPAELTGRVQGALFLIGGSLYPFAALVNGFLVERYSTRAALGLDCAVLSVVLALSMAPAFRRTTALAEAHPAAPDLSAVPLSGTHDAHIGRG